MAFGNPFVSTSECRSLDEPSLSAPVKTGVAAAISHWWLRNDPPNAPWKKRSEIA